MTMLTRVIMLTACCISLLSCNSQTGNVSTGNQTSGDKSVGGPCEACDLMYTGMPENIDAVDTCSDWFLPGQKLMITGTIFKADGKTPAPDVVLYYYHTDSNGLYPQKQDKPENNTRHGYLRGWVKTDSAGSYTIYTQRPVPYPDGSMPAHIHPIIKETGYTEYYIDEFVFDDDKLLTGDKRKALENRGGSGILRVLLDGDTQVAEHNIVLGLHVTGYPKIVINKKQSGLSVGEDNPSFIPYHAWGPDKGTRTCPVCKYGRYHGLIYFVGNKPNWEQIKKWLVFLEREGAVRSKYLKVYFVYGNEKNYNKALRESELEAIGQELNLKNTALTFVPSMQDEETEVNLNKINPEVENTFIIYRQRSIIDKFINLEANEENFNIISKRLDNTTGRFFHLPEPVHN